MGIKPKMEEKVCEECGDEYDKEGMEEGSMSSMTKSARQQVQDEYDMEDEKEEMEEEKSEVEGSEDEEEIEEQYGKKEDMKEEEEDMEDEEDEEMEDMEESFNRIFEGQDLTEDFKLKVSTIFEAAVNNRVKIVENELATKFTNLLESEVENIANDLTEKVDSYLNYVVSEWMEENKLAVERGIRTDVAESFISGLKSLFNEHNISVPEGQTDLLDETANNLEKVTEQLNNQIKKTLELTEELKKYQRAEIFAEVAESLSAAQADKLRGLAENMSFSDNKEFKTKLEILKENYMNSSKQKASVSSIQVEDTSEPEQLNESPSEVNAYLHALLRKTK